jgi:hypothetical protein
MPGCEPAAGRPVWKARRGPTLALAAVAVVVTLYWGFCKTLLFRDLEYVGPDLYSFLDMTWSWHFEGRLLYENAQGSQAAIHNFYLLPAFFPLTIWLGAYGLFLGLLILEMAAVLRVVTTRALELSSRIVVLGGLLSPIAFFAFDDKAWGFHPELCYPPLAALFAIDLIERGSGRAILIAATMVLVKEDGAVLCGALLVAYFAARLWDLRSGPREERRKLTKAAALSLFVVALVFVAGIVLLWAMGRHTPVAQLTAPYRIERALRVLGRTLTAQAVPERGLFLREGLTGYALGALVMLLPLGRRYVRGLLLLLVSAPGVVALLAVSASYYKFAFGMLLWAPRVATLLALVVGCLAFALAARPALRPAPSMTAVAMLSIASWGLQLLLLTHVDYALWPRVNASALVSGRGYRITRLPRREVRFLRCTASRLPRGMLVEPVRWAFPLFHHQSIVFSGREAHAWRRPRLRIVPASVAAPTEEEGFCRGPSVGDLAVEAACDVLPKVASCGLWAGSGSREGLE